MAGSKSVSCSDYRPEYGLTLGAAHIFAISVPVASTIRRIDSPYPAVGLGIRTVSAARLR
jgi:hypothetical protein